MDYKSLSKVRIDIPKILEMVQNNLTSDNKNLSSGEVITRCFKLLDILFDSWPESFMQDLSTLYPIVLVSII